VVLVQTGELVSAGNLMLASDASRTALIDGSGTGNVNGNVTMQRYLPSKFGYRYFSSPFVAATVNEFADDMDLASSWPMLYAMMRAVHRLGGSHIQQAQPFSARWKDMLSISDQLPLPALLT
jgi:hypothetical protein